ncbi:hypothetical protein BU61_3206 [Pontoporia blainvillei]|uniref:Uncharacterized protein n=1 Tax=Pontoporia blainvillei TaxID=48723 RepID=A0ABX0S3L6_PONBL|nr:hypothetical protein [Pontoporia blainvillei]
MTRTNRVAQRFTQVGPALEHITVQENVSARSSLGSTGNLPYEYKIVIAGNHELTFDKEFMADLVKQDYYRFPSVSKLKPEDFDNVQSLLTNSIYLQDSEALLLLCLPAYIYPIAQVRSQGSPGNYAAATGLFRNRTSEFRVEPLPAAPEARGGPFLRRTSRQTVLPGPEGDLYPALEFRRPGPYVGANCGERGLLFVAVRELLIAVASLVAEHGC